MQSRELSLFSKWPHLSAEKLNAGRKDFVNRVETLGFTSERCCTDLGNTAAEVVKGKRSNRSYAVVAIGTGPCQTLPCDLVLLIPTPLHS